MTLRQAIELFRQFDRLKPMQEALDRHRELSALLDSPWWGGGAIEPESKPPHPGITVREQRHRLGWSQEKLAKEARCARHTVSDLELQKKVLKKSTLDDIQGALHKALHKR